VRVNIEEGGVNRKWWELKKGKGNRMGLMERGGNFIEERVMGA
jgi:hypothetical protein